MRIVQILGGLGNQMWQYAMLVALREHFKEEQVFYHALYFNGYPLHNGFELERIFKITSTQAPLKEVRRLYHFFTSHYFFSQLYRHFFPTRKSEIREVLAGLYMKEAFEHKGDCYYNGYWADHRYFDSCRSILLKEFELKEKLDERNITFLKNLENRITCSIHVRRGDYLKHPDFNGICGYDYYEKAISLVKEKFGNDVFFLVFSNDINWCKECLSKLWKGYESKFVDWNIGRDSYKDMYLMSQCNVNIIANSSFSWWAAYLNETKDNMVIAPHKFKNRDMGFDINLDKWISI